MNVLAMTCLETDVPYWVERADFYRHFDQVDFLNRDAATVVPAYLSDWFHVSDAQTVFFKIPVVGSVCGRTCLVGTRHRLAVLLDHMDPLPIAFVMAHMTDEGRRLFETIPRKPLVMSEPFWIPDLPIRDVLP